MTILSEIYAYKRVELTRRKQRVPFNAIKASVRSASPPLDFVSALRRNRPTADNGAAPAAEARYDTAPPLRRWPALIAEVKFASPSRGILLSTGDPLDLARLYQQNGAAAISVLTDEHYFNGHLDYLGQIAGWPAHPPLLCKDFIFDPYQVYEARAAGADAVLLIVAGLSREQLLQLHALTLELGMTPLVEVHTRKELHTILACEPRLIGINNRDLHDFSITLETTRRLRAQISPGIPVVAESGIHSPADVIFLAQAGVDAILVGEALVTAPDIPARVRQLSGQEVCL
jgi:indole-3-glycerol phosphate synthase